MKTQVFTALAVSIVLSAATSADAALLAFDDFSTYSAGDIGGQAGSPTGFTGMWTANPGVSADTGAFVQVTENSRSVRDFGAGVTGATGTIYIRFDATLNIGNFSGIELPTSGGAYGPGIRIDNEGTGGTFLRVSVDGGGSSGGGNLLFNDAASHNYLIELNLGTGAGNVWIDPNTLAFVPGGGVAFTAPTGFSLDALQPAGFGNPSSTTLDNFQIGNTLSDVGVTAAPAPEPSALTLMGLGLVGLVARRRRRMRV